MRNIPFRFVPLMNLIEIIGKDEIDFLKRLKSNWPLSRFLHTRSCCAGGSVRRRIEDTQSLIKSKQNKSCHEGNTKWIHQRHDYLTTHKQ